jgi:hypothetical protein
MRSHQKMRRLHEALLLALLLVAVQTAILAHGHEDSASSGVAAQSCEFCAGHHAAAPAPESAGSHHPDHRSTISGGLPVVAAAAAPVRSAHRSRAPPAFRSA